MILFKVYKLEGLERGSKCDRTKGLGKMSGQGGVWVSSAILARSSGAAFSVGSRGYHRGGDVAVI